MIHGAGCFTSSHYTPLPPVQEIDLAKGVALFFRKALGGVAIGIFFGLLICLALKMFNRRFNREENVTEVSMVLGLVYVGYWCADYLWATSGVIATVVAGLLVKLLGSAMLNDSKLLDDFWSLLEHVLNTVLFTLGKELAARRPRVQHPFPFSLCRHGRWCRLG